MKKLIAVILAVCLLSGCQLASGETKESPIQDKLVGVFITFEHLDLEFDMEGYLSDNIDRIADGEEIVIEPGEGMEYEEKLWAAVTEEGWSFPGSTDCEWARCGRMTTGRAFQRRAFRE